MSEKLLYFYGGCTQATLIARPKGAAQQPVPGDFPLFKRCEWRVQLNRVQLNVTRDVVLIYIYALYLTAECFQENHSNFIQVKTFYTLIYRNVN